MLCIFYTVILEPSECHVYHKNLIVIRTIFTSDVKTVFLNKTGNCFVKIGFYRLPDYVMSRHVSDLWFETSDCLTIEPIVSGIIVTCLSHLLSIDRLFASPTCLLHGGHGPHARCTDAAKQMTVAYLSVRAQRRHCSPLKLVVLQLTVSDRSADK